MREYGIIFDGATGLPEGHYVLHRRDGLSLPTVFGSFAGGRCGPIDGIYAMRLCAAMGHELSKVERFCMHSGEVTQVWPATSEAFAAAGELVPDEPTAPRLDPHENGPNIEMESPVDIGEGPSLDEVLAGAPEGTLPATPEPIAPARDSKPKGKKKG